MKNLFTVLIIVVSFLTIYPQDTIYVPADYATIQAGINAATNGDIVLVEDGTYIENINYRGKAITVASRFLENGDTNHIINTIIDGSQPSNPDSGSTVYFNSGEDTNSVICGFTITGGSGTFIPAGSPPSPPFNVRVGGGIYIDTDMGARIINNIIENNVISTEYYASGGGINADMPGGLGYTIIEDNIIRNNSASGEINYTSGGGIFMGGSGRITRNIISGNLCHSVNADAVGGGIRLMVQDASLESRHCLIENNYIENNHSVSDNGNAHAGGINSSGIVIIMRYNIILNNVVESKFDSWGAAMHVGALRYAESRIENNLFSGNHHIGNGSCYGGAIYIHNSHPVMGNNIFYNNEAFNGGAIYMVNDSRPVFINNNFIGNNAANAGGGIFSSQSTLIVINCIVWDNSSLIGKQIYSSGGANFVTYSDVQGSWSGAGNINSDPIFSDTLFHLSDNSPCIGAGIDSIEVNDTWYYCPPFCYYGNSRPNPENSMPDIGACENPQGTPTSVKNKPDQVPYKYSLEQNYPNPFNPKTTIIFGLPKASEVKLTLYNALGEEVAGLFEGYRNAGYHRVEFDASKLPSGVYFYRLQAVDPSTSSGQVFVQTKKMLLLK
jgi:hypothetical protein